MQSFDISIIENVKHIKREDGITNLHVHSTHIQQQSNS